MKKINGNVILGVIAAALIALTSAMPAAAAPVPPASLTYQQGVSNSNPKRIIFAQSRVFTADTRLDAQVVQNYGQIDLQYVIEGFAGGSETVQFGLLHSNDATYWMTGTNMLPAAVTIVTATTDMTRTALFGSYAAVFVDINGVIPVTMTIIGLAR